MTDLPTTGAGDRFFLASDGLVFVPSANTGGLDYHRWGQGDRHIRPGPRDSVRTGHKLAPPRSTRAKTQSSASTSTCTILGDIHGPDHWDAAILASRPAIRAGLCYRLLHPSFSGPSSSQETRRTSSTSGAIHNWRRQLMRRLPECHGPPPGKRRQVPAPCHRRHRNCDHSTPIPLPGGPSLSRLYATSPASEKAAIWVSGH